MTETRSQPEVEDIPESRRRLGDELPPPVSIDLEQSVQSYWLHRARQHIHDSYAGIPLSKFPEDLRVYEHLLWASKANVVIEIGVQFGGSTLWFRDRLATMARYKRIAAPNVFGIDLDTAPAKERIERADPDYADQITLIDGDVCDPELPARIARLLPPGSRCFVVEDSAHIFETTWAALDGFAGFVPVHGYFVVEDGCVDIEQMRLDDWPRGVLPALEAWLKTSLGSEFAVRRDLECYGISCHPRGFLQRRSGPRG